MSIRKWCIHIIAFYLISIIAMRVIQSVFSKWANILLPSGIPSYTKYLAVSQVLATLFALVAIFLSPSAFSNFDALTLLIATCSGAFLTINSLCGIKALKSGTMVLSSIFSTAGLVIPSILGVVFFDDEANIFQGIFLIALIASMCMLAAASKKIYGNFNIKNAVYLIGNLVSNGMVMFCQKLFGELRPQGNISLFSMLTFAIPAVALTVTLLFIKPDQCKKTVFPKQLYICALFLAFAVFIIQQFVTILTSKMSTVLLFAFVNCSATIISAVVGAIMYKEKLTFKSSVAVVIGVISLIGLKIFE